MTQELDLIISVPGNSIRKILSKAITSGFEVDVIKAQTDIKERGTFKVYHEGFWIDVIMSSTSFEKSVFKR